jgi:hypothetical protein
VTETPSELEGRTVTIPGPNGPKQVPVTDAATELADLHPVLASLREELAELETREADLRVALQGEVGVGTPVPTPDGRRVVLVETEGRRSVQKGVCDEHRPALVRLGYMRVETVEVEQVTYPKVGDLTDPKAKGRLAAAGLDLGKLVAGTKRVEAVVVDADGVDTMAEAA